MDLSIIGDIFQGLWAFANGWAGVAVSAGSVALIVACCGAAHVLRPKAPWLATVLGIMASAIAMWWAFGILPSAWVYFSGNESTLMSGTVIPTSLPLLSNFYIVFRDVVVVLETGVAILGFVVIALWIQKRYPISLAEGEEARPQSGGYK